MVWYGTPLQSQMVAPVKGHKLLKECFATCHYLSLCPKYITSNLSEKNRACTQSVSYKSWSEMPKNGGIYQECGSVLLEILKLPNFTSRFLHYKNNSIKKFPKPMYGWMKCTSHKKHVKDRSIVGNTHTKVISIDESIIKWGRPCQMLSFLNKGAC